MMVGVGDLPRSRRQYSCRLPSCPVMRSLRFRLLRYRQSRRSRRTFPTRRSLISGVVWRLSSAAKLRLAGECAGGISAIGPIAALSPPSSRVGYRWKCGRHLLALSLSHPDPM